MAEVYPFRALRFSPARVPIPAVVTQPYDKISKEMQQHYYNAHPNNIVRIVLGKSKPQDSPEDNTYTRAAAYLNEWRLSGVLEQLDSPAFFVYFQRFVIPGTGEAHTRQGFIGLGQLEEYSKKIVFPHERTLSGPKTDRLELLRHTRTHLEQIFMLYEDPAQRIDRMLTEVTSREPDTQVIDEYGAEHTLWATGHPDIVGSIQREMAGKKLIIADGHHRYETALAYRDEVRAATGRTDPGAPHNCLPMTFFNMDAPGLTILPTHRVVSKLDNFDSNAFVRCASEFFDVEEAPQETGSLRAGLQARGERRSTVAACMDKGTRSLFLSLKTTVDLRPLMPDLSQKQRALDVVLLHRLLLDKCLGISEDAVKKESYIKYVRELSTAVDAVRDGAAQISFLLNPTPLHAMRDIAYEGNVMPQKSTDFYPKVLSGLVMYPLE
jgi:uncharacterized protein (DUF1015 family)